MQMKGTKPLKVIEDERTIYCCFVILNTKHIMLSISINYVIANWNSDAVVVLSCAVMEKKSVQVW